jgi:hypothetical protein
MTPPESQLPPDPRKIRIIEKAARTDRAMLTSRGLERLLLQIKRQFLPYYFVRPPLWKVVVRSKLDRRRMLPDFSSIGAARSGTSLLCAYIMQHPCVVLPLAKEIGTTQYPVAHLIRAQFPTLRDKRRIERKHGLAITGYCTPVMTSFMFPYLASTALARGMKLIVIMRNPVDRTFAHWKWDQALLGVKNDTFWANYPDFSEYVRVELEAIDSKTTSGMSLPVGGYIQNSIYLPFLRLLFRFMERERTMFINSTDFFQNPVATAKEVYSFLGLPTYEPVEMAAKNAGPKGEMDPETRRALQEFFAPLNEQLYEFLGRDFHWS